MMENVENLWRHTKQIIRRVSTNASREEVEPLRLKEECTGSPSHSEADNHAEDLSFSSDNEELGVSWQYEVQRRRHFWSWLRDHCYPPDLPFEVQLLRWENLAIPASYLLVGILQGMLRPLLNVWPLDMGATEAQQTTLSQIATLPAAFKILFGFLSDNVPIARFRRKPYMGAGWLLCSYMMVRLLQTFDLTMQHNLKYHRYFELYDEPPLSFLGISFFLYGTGLWCADVMADSLIAFKTRAEPDSYRGQLQASCIVCRFFGLMVSAPTATYVYSQYGAESIVQVLMVAPLCVIPLVIIMDEDLSEPPRITEQCCEIWRTICKRSVWQPMAFIYMFNLLQVSNSAWRQFLSSSLNFTAAHLNMLLVVSYVFLYVGTLTYKSYFLHVSWRRLYQVSIAVNCVLSCLQLLLIREKTMGIPPFWFALGDDAFTEFIVGVQFLPAMILMVSLCPSGSEGASYAMFTTVFNSAQMIAPAISSCLLGIWDVSKKSIEDGELDGVFNLTILTALIQTSPILLINFLPHGRRDLNELAKQPYSGSYVGGAIFLLVLSGSLAYTVAVSISNIVKGGLS